MSDEELDDLDAEPESAPSWLRDDWDGTIVYARFEQQNAGNWALVLKSVDEATGEEYTHQPLSVGGKDKGWVSHDGGEEIMGATLEQRYHPRTRIAQWIDDCSKAGARPELLKRSKELYDRRGRFFAELWMGLRFHYDIKQVTEDRPDKENEGGPWVPTKVMAMKPTKFLGVAGVVPKESASTTSSPSTSATNGDISAEDLEILTGLAMKNDNHDKFVDAVMAAPDSQGEIFLRNPKIRPLLSKMSWYESLKA